MSLKGNHKNKLQFILNNINKFNINFSKEKMQNANGNNSSNQPFPLIALSEIFYFDCIDPFIFH